MLVIVSDFNPVSFSLSLFALLCFLLFEPQSVKRNQDDFKISSVATQRAVMWDCRFSRYSLALQKLCGWFPPAPLGILQTRGGTVKL